MTPSDAAELLALAAAYDRRTVGHADALAWAAALHNVDATDAHTAIVEHYRTTRDWIMPVDVVTRVAKMRRDRLAAVFETGPDADPDDVPAYLAALRAGRTQIASADPTTPRPVAALTVGKTIPRPDYADAPRKARALLARAARERAATDTPAHRQRLAQARAELEAAGRPPAKTGQPQPEQPATPAAATPTVGGPDASR